MQKLYTLERAQPSTSRGVVVVVVVIDHHYDYYYHQVPQPPFTECLLDVGPSTEFFTFIILFTTALEGRQ